LEATIFATNQLKIPLFLNKDDSSTKNLFETPLTSFKRRSLNLFLSKFFFSFHRNCSYMQSVGSRALYIYILWLELWREREREREGEKEERERVGEGGVGVSRCRLRRGNRP
jgi:hypothetical protein